MSEPPPSYNANNSSLKDPEFDDAGQRWSWYVERFRDVLKEQNANPPAEDTEIGKWYERGIHPKGAANLHAIDICPQEWGAQDGEQ